MLLTDIRFCGKDDIGLILTADRESPHPWPESVIISDLSGDSRVSYVGAFAPADGELLLGYAVLGEEKGNGLLMNLLVLPSYRRLGIGIQLVSACSVLADYFGFTKLALRVRMTNYAALALYRNLGFRCDATRGDFYSDGSVAGYMSAPLPL